MTCENYLKFKLQCPEMKLYQNTAMPICVHLVSGCFCATTELIASIETV